MSLNTVLINNALNTDQTKQISLTQRENTRENVPLTQVQDAHRTRPNIFLLAEKFEIILHFKDLKYVTAVAVYYININIPSYMPVKNICLFLIFVCLISF